MWIGFVIPLMSSQGTLSIFYIFIRFLDTAFGSLSLRSFWWMCKSHSVKGFGLGNAMS